MIYFVHFLTASGEIRQVSSCSDNGFFAKLPVAPAGTSRLLIAEKPSSVATYMTANYVSGGEVVPKITMTPTISATGFAANGVASVTISGLPNPCQVTITGVIAGGPEIVTDGEVVLTSDQPGDVIVSVRADPDHLPWSVTIHAN